MLVSVCCKKGVQFFDDQATEGTIPTYSWKKMEMDSPFDDMGIMIACIYSEGHVVEYGGTLYVGAINDPGSFIILSKYNINSGEWEELENDGTDTKYEYEVPGPFLVELNGYIYAIGGTDYDRTCRSINKYDIANDCWVKCCDLKAEVTECSLSVIEKKVLILDTKFYQQGDEHNAIIQMYDPAKNESFIVLEAAGLEIHSLRNEDLRLAVLSGVCYVICDPEQENADSGGELNSPKRNDDSAVQVEQNPRVFEQNPRVFKLVCNLDSDSPSVVLGEEIPQTHPHRNNYIRAFCIENKTFVNVHGCVHKIKDGIANEDDLEKWRNITKMSFRPVHFTHDRKKLGGAADKGDIAEEDEEEEDEEESE